MLIHEGIIRDEGIFLLSDGDRVGVGIIRSGGELKMGEGDVFEGFRPKESRDQLGEEIGVMEDGVRPSEDDTGAGTGGGGEEIEQ